MTTETAAVFGEHRRDSREIDAGIARAGAAAAAKRRELGITQRGLARDNVINAGALIAFEKGRSWPRQETRARLEHVLGWRPGTISRIRSGGPAPSADIREQPVEDHSLALLVGAVTTAVAAASAGISALPAPESVEFGERVAGILAGLRELESLSVHAVLSAASSPGLAVALSAVRRLYSDLMCRAARSPFGTTGQRLFSARRTAALTAEDVASATGLPVHVIKAAEADGEVAPEAIAVIQSFIAALRGK